ncbi:hypothetical protein ACF0H5_006473 [Mactra antiquata]
MEDGTDGTAVQFGTKLDGSTVDLTYAEDGTSESITQQTSSSLNENFNTSSDVIPTSETASSMSDAEADMETTEVLDDVSAEQVIDNPNLDEPLTPATDISTTKSLPGSGRVTPASQSDQSVTFSSSEKSTPNRKIKISEVTGRQIEFDNLSSSSGSIKNVHFPNRVGISWRKGEKLEAMDYLDSWFPAKIRAINEEDMQVLIHFDGWNQRFDEWIDMASERIRPLVRHSERKGKKRLKGDHVRVDPCLPNTGSDLLSKRTLKEHKIGDAVYAKWTDCKMYPAKITNIMKNGTYEVIFYDGFKKLVQPINIRPMPGDNKLKAFEINPVPEVVLKKAKMKLDSTDIGFQEEKAKLKPEFHRDSSTEKERKPRSKKKKNIIPAVVPKQIDLSTCTTTESNVSEIVTCTIAKSEPVWTQTEYTDSKVPVEGLISQIPVTTASMSSTIIPGGIIPPKAFVVESDHNQYKCPYDGCNKGFRKEHLLDYHIKYYHINDGRPPPPPAKRRRKTTSTCSTEPDTVSVSKKSAGKKNRNLSAECPMDEQDVKLEFVDFPLTYSETGEISTQTSPSKHSDLFDYSVRGELKIQDSLEESSVTDAEDFLKPDELVNCICDFQEENGLMIQCEVCMCWQHAACFGITERTLPKTYVCFVCENPPGVRDSGRYIHEQDWFKTGEIASFSYLPLTPMSEDRCNAVKSTHTLVAEIHQLNAVLHSLKLQLKILRTKDECKLKQWRLDWDVVETDVRESCPNTDDKHVSSNTTVDGQNVAVNIDTGVAVKMEPDVAVKMETDQALKTDVTVKTEPDADVKSDNDGDEVFEMKEKCINVNTEVTSDVKRDINLQVSNNKTIEIGAETIDLDILPEVNEKSQVQSLEVVQCQRSEKVQGKSSEMVQGQCSDIVQGQMSDIVQGKSVNKEVVQKEADVNVTKEMNGVEHSKPGSDGDVIDYKPEAEPEAGLNVDIKTEDIVVKLENPKEVKQEPVERLEEGDHSDSTESVVEDPIELYEKNLLSHILRVQAEIGDRFDKIEEQVEMLEAMEAVQSRREPPTMNNVLNDVPQLKRSLRYMLNDLTKVKKMSVFH